MLDVPQHIEDVQKAQAEHIYMMEDNKNYRTSAQLMSRDLAISQKAKEISDLYADGFQWSDISTMINLGFDFLKNFQDLSFEEKKDLLVTLLERVIDDTDTPLLPDYYTDPLFKSMIPPIMDIVLSAEEGLLSFLPVLSDEKADSVTFQKYAEKLQASFSDGFQWADIATVIRCSVEFVAGFHNLTKEEQQHSTIDIVNFVIDATDTPFLPDTFIDPVFKALTKPLVELIFSYF